LRADADDQSLDEPAAKTRQRGQGGFVVEDDRMEIGDTAIVAGFGAVEVVALGSCDVCGGRAFAFRRPDTVDLCWMCAEPHEAGGAS
jgi:hypothetical protein